MSSTELNELELEAKFDEDFLFYLNFCNTFLKNIQSEEVLNKAQLWLSKLIGEPCDGIHKKRCRNIYLANLLICMQNGILESPFTSQPQDVDILNANEVFGPFPNIVEQPEWLNDTHIDPSKLQPNGCKKRPGRTYVATRTLPNGQGALAYVGLSLSNEEPLWMEGKESVLEVPLAKKSKEEVVGNEIEKILSKRKDPKDREKVLAFYDVLLKHITDELSGKETVRNETIEDLLLHLIKDLLEQNQYEKYKAMEPGVRRLELLLILYDKVKKRRDKVSKRKELLDNLEVNLMPKAALGDLPKKYSRFPENIWQTIIEKYPSQENMEKLLKVYSPSFVEDFSHRLYDHKKALANKLKQRYQNIVSHMKMELKKETERMKNYAEEAEMAYTTAKLILQAVRERYQLKQKIMEHEDIPENSKTYEKMKEAMYDIQKKVEEEALRGKFLADEINSVNEQTEMLVNISDNIIETTEKQNLKTLKNIEKLTKAIKQYESIIEDLRNISSSNVM